MRTKQSEIMTDDPGTLEEADAINAAQPAIDLEAIGEVLELAQELAKNKRLTVAARLELQSRIEKIAADDEQTRDEFLIELTRIMDAQ